MTLPLAGIRVLDMSSIIAAPVAATTLGDFGAEIVKIEDPGRGDFMRRNAREPGGRSLQWIQDARNKTSITLDLRKPEAREIVHRLLPHFDVLVSNFRPPTLRRWGFDPDTLRRRYPRLIALYVTGYGLTGPYADRGAFDRVASAFSGLTYVTGDADFLLVVVVPSMAHYEALTRRLFFGANNVKRFKTFVAMDRVKVGLAASV